MSLPDDKLADLIRHHHGEGPARDLTGDADAQAMLAEWQAQNAALAALFPPAPGDPVPERMRAALAAARRPAGSWQGKARAIAAGIALFALGAGTGWLAAPRLAPAPPTTLAAAALRAHETYVVEVAHPVEVQATEEAHLVKWLTKRLGRPVVAPELASAGFHLVGGRLLPGDTAPAALFMYENDRGQRLTLYIAPQPDSGDTAFRFVEADGNQGFWWTDGGLGCAIIGPVGRDAMRAIALAAYEQLA